MGFMQKNFGKIDICFDSLAAWRRAANKSRAIDKGVKCAARWYKF